MPGVETHLRQPDRRCQKTETVIQARRRYTPGVGYSGMTVLAFGALRSTCQSPKVRQRFRALRTRLRILGGIFHRIIVPLYSSVRVDPSLTAACVNIPHQRSGLGVSLPRQFPLTVLAIYFLHKQDGSFVPPPPRAPPTSPSPDIPFAVPIHRLPSLLPPSVRCAMFVMYRICIFYRRRLRVPPVLVRVQAGSGRAGGPAGHTVRRPALFVAVPRVQGTQGEE